MTGALTVDGLRSTGLFGGGIFLFPVRLLLSDVSLMSELTLAESDRRSSVEPILVEVLQLILRLEPKFPLVGG